MQGHRYETFSTLTGLALPVGIGISLPESDTYLVPAAFQQTCAAEIFHHCSGRLLRQQPAETEQTHRG